MLPSYKPNTCLAVYKSINSKEKTKQNNLRPLVRSKMSYDALHWRGVLRRFRFILCRVVYGNGHKCCTNRSIVSLRPVGFRALVSLELLLQSLDRYKYGVVYSIKHTILIILCNYTKYNIHRWTDRHRQTELGYGFFSFSR